VLKGLAGPQAVLLNIRRQTRNSTAVFVSAIDIEVERDLTTANANASKGMCEKANRPSSQGGQGGRGFQPSTLTFREPSLHRAEHASKPITAAECPLRASQTSTHRVHLTRSAHLAAASTGRPGP
jgi:hypothetical protein